jgi:TetR/AcrR family transcriptional regulator, transcriptional repressor for nem operon
MRRSRSETAQTRERIVSTASKMFLDEGLAAVGMRDVMAGASLTQGGFYRHFESKEQLIAEANSAAFDRLFAMFETATADKSPAEAVEKIVSLYLGQSQDKKNIYLCPLSMLGAELSHGDAQVRAVATSGYQRLVQLIADRLTYLAKREGLAVASGIVSTMVGAVTLANVAPEQETARSILRDAQELIRARLSSFSTGGRRSGMSADGDERRKRSRS